MEAMAVSEILRNVEPGQVRTYLLRFLLTCRSSRLLLPRSSKFVGTSFQLLPKGTEPTTAQQAPAWSCTLQTKISIYSRPASSLLPHPDPGPLGPSSCARLFWMFQHDCQFASFYFSTHPKSPRQSLRRRQKRRRKRRNEETTVTTGRQATGHYLYTPCRPHEPQGPKSQTGSRMVHRNIVRAALTKAESSRPRQAMTPEPPNCRWQSLRLLFRHAKCL
ncbi:hypothetical protein B0T13DRAFT_136151 [Neurospora crassa]|nr:hypothetical protein B0T13DRAFT_136151 [Neurospora crassa]